MNARDFFFCSDEDDILLLKAQLGYLKKKLSMAGKAVDVNDASQPIIFVITPTHTRAGSYHSAMTLSMVMHRIIMKKGTLRVWACFMLARVRTPHSKVPHSVSQSLGNGDKF